MGEEGQERPFCVKNACTAGGEESCDADLHATMPNKMEALSDTCLQIPCSFDPVSPNNLSKPIFGVWIKSNSSSGHQQKHVVSDSRQPDDKYPIRIIGNMSEYDCTSVITRLNSSYADQYYFRVESYNRGYKATDTCNPLTITVNGKRSLLDWGSIF